MVETDTRQTHIAWITQGAMLDTDIYVLKPLSSRYDIDCYILKTDRDYIDYDISVLEGGNVKTEVVHLPGRILNRERFFIFLNLVKKISKCDIAYIILSGQPWLIPIASRYLNKERTIIGIHNVHILKGGIHPTVARIYRDMALNRFRFFGTFSESQRNLLMKMKPGKKVFLTRLVPRDYGEASIKKDDETVTFLAYGNIRRYKRFDVLINAAQRLHEKDVDDFKIIIAGKCDNWNEYQALIKYPEIFDLRIKRIDNKDLPNLFEETSYVVLPYQDIAQSAVALAAVRYEKPMIASRLEALEEIVKDGYNGFVMNPADVDDLERIMEKTMSLTSDEYKNLVNNMKSVRGIYSEESILEEYRTMFDTVMSSGDK